MGVILLLACPLLLLAAAEAWAPAAGVLVHPDGRIGLAELVLTPMHFDRSWRATAPPGAVTGQGRRQEGGWRLEGAWRTAAASGRLVETVSWQEGGLRIEARLHDAGPTNVFCLALDLDGGRYRGAALRIDGQELPLPERSPQPGLRGGPARRIAVPLAEGWLELSGALSLLVQDNRSWGPDSLTIRLQAGADGVVSCQARLLPYAAGEAPPPALAPEVVAADARWHPIGMAWEVQPGSVLDLSPLTAAPVERPLTVRDGQWCADRGGPMRLLGANLCFSANFPEPDDAPRVAMGLRRFGHNAVRFHHHDGALVPPGGNGSVLDPAALDRLDRLAAACIAQGLHLTTDIYVSRRIPRGAIPELADRELGMEFKPLIYLLPSALENWKRFATAFLSHRNPHTGRTWAAEPALAFLSLVNEGNLTTTWDDDPAVAALFEERFAAWLATRSAGARLPERRPAERAVWLAGLQAAGAEAMRAHVRSLGVTAPVTDANFHADWWSLAARDGLDLIDNHAYHDHPHFPQQRWRLPYAFQQRDPVATLLEVPAGLAATRRLDRPFTVSELNYVYPNRHRAAYAVGVPAVAGIQGWDGLWRFAAAHDRRLFADTGAAAGFDLLRDPIALLSERAVALLWRRGDVHPAPWAAAVVYDPVLAGGLPGQAPPVAALALHARVGCLPAAGIASAAVPGLRCLLVGAGSGVVPSGGLPVIPADARMPEALVAAGLAAADAFAPAQGRIRSPDGQVAIDASAGRLTIASATSVAAVLPGGGEALLGGHRLVNRDAEPATVVVAALDGDLERGRRLLVLHLTDAVATGLRFQDRRRLRVLDWGRPPMLVRAGSLELGVAGAPITRAWAIDLTGGRREALPPAGPTLHLSVVRPWGACLAYELERDPAPER